MRSIILATCLLSLLLAPGFLFADKKKPKADTTAVKPATDSVSVKKDSTKTVKKDPFKPIKEVTDKCRKYAGLFNLYQDTLSGKLYLEISEDKLGREFIYFAHSMDGVLDAGYVRGGYRDNSVFTIERYFDRIDLKLQNTTYYFDPQNPLSKAENANINQPVFLSEKIAAASTDTGDSKLRRYLIEADNLFLGENFMQVKPSKQPGDRGDGFNLGTLSNKKSKYIWVKSFPENSDVAVEYVYENPQPVNYGSDEVTDARFVSIKLQHTLMAMPESDYTPRYDDPRVGFFIDKVTDQTSTDVTPWRDLINRWNLKKKDPAAALSEPVKPIVWWIEKTTPLELRPVIRDAILRWNIAFEAAGFKNAVQVYEQADTATWESEDVRYNVVRWTSSPRPPFGGYGPRFTNPRTGEILSADIMLEFIYLTNRLNVEKLFDVAALDGFGDPGSEDHCQIGEVMHNNLLSGLQMMSAYGFSEFDKDEFLKQALYDLTLHEVGHTLGLNHNFIASQMNDMNRLQDKSYGENTGLTASVMDYTIPNISPDKNKQGLYFDNRPGPYDLWAIQFGYTTYADSAAEQKGRQALLSQSTRPEYRFFNDGDDMRSSGKGIDPRVMLYDMSSDAITYAMENTDMVNATYGKLLGKYGSDDQSYQELRNAYLILSGNHGRNLNTISRYIGGVYIDRSFAGQNPNSKPLTPVAYADQKRAMDALNKYCFSKDAFNASASLYNYLQIQRRGFLRENEDPKIHDRVLNIQRGVLDQLLNPATAQRIVDTRLYGNSYPINSVLKDLTDAIFQEDLAGPVNSLRQNLQGEYVNRLIGIAAPQNNAYTYPVKSAAFAHLLQVRKWMELYKGTDASTQAHRAYLLQLIKQALETK